MVTGLLGAFGAALGYGVASVLQAVAARQSTTVDGLDPRLLLRLLRSWRYLLSLGLDGLAFVLSLAALRSLPLFVVQAVVASSLAVTAVLGAVVLRTPLRRPDVLGLIIVVLGLAGLASAAAEDRTVSASPSEHWGVLVAAALLAGLAIPLARLSGAAGAAVLGGVAGLAYGAVAVAARILPASWSPRVLLTDPASYGLLLAGAVALLIYPIALQRGSVTQATAPLVVAETLAPAAVGVLLLGDEPRAGLGWLAALGFALAVGGALSLARHGEGPAADP